MSMPASCQLVPGACWGGGETLDPATFPLHLRQHLSHQGPRPHSPCTLRKRRCQYCPRAGQGEASQGGPPSDNHPGPAAQGRASCVWNPLSAGQQEALPYTTLLTRIRSGRFGSEYRPSPTLLQARPVCFASVFSCADSWAACPISTRGVGREQAPHSAQLSSWTPGPSWSPRFARKSSHWPPGPDISLCNCQQLCSASLQDLPLTVGPGVRVKRAPAPGCRGACPPLDVIGAEQVGPTFYLPGEPCA